MTVKTIMLDQDGTLADSVELLYRVYLQFLEARGKSGSHDEFYGPLNGPTIPETVAYLKKTYQLEGEVRELTVGYQKIVREAYASVKPIEGAEELVDTLYGRQFQLVLVTSGYRDVTGPFVESQGWENYFDHRIHGDGIEKSKPDPSIYLAALQQSGADPNECVAVEDSENGVRAARAAGIYTIGFAADGREETIDSLREAGANDVVTHLSHVPNVVRGVHHVET